MLRTPLNCRSAPCCAAAFQTLQVAGERALWFTPLRAALSRARLLPHAFGWARQGRQTRGDRGVTRPSTSRAPAGVEVFSRRTMVAHAGVGSTLKQEFTYLDVAVAARPVERSPAICAHTLANVHRLADGRLRVETRPPSSHQRKRGSAAHASDRCPAGTPSSLVSGSPPNGGFILRSFVAAGRSPLAAHQSRWRSSSFSEPTSSMSALLRP